MSETELLIDVSRLIWRAWRGRPPTGIDRVCLAYVEHFGSRAQAVVQRGGRFFVLTSQHSHRLFNLFAQSRGGFRRDFVRLAIGAFPAAQSRPPNRGLLYLNVGHTGLNERSLAGWISANGVRAVFLIHDIIPLLYPEYCRAGEAAKHEQRIYNALTTAHAVIGNSRATISDIERFAISRGLSMPPALAAWIAGPATSDKVEPRQFDRPHFVTVGTIEARKNHALLLHIWKNLAAKYQDNAPKLAIVGQRGWEANEAISMLDRALDLQHHVVEIENASDDELASIVAGARALLMPSFAEGFGLPIAEALQLGTPVIASDLPVYREFAGHIPTYLNPLDGPGWQAAIETFMADSPERERQLSEMTGFQPPDWYTHFKVVEEWLQTLS